MKHPIRNIALILAVLAVISFAAWVTSTKAAGISYYVDCSAGSNGAGTQASPWNTLSTVNSTTFQPGDTIFFKRGTTCMGQLNPDGSGTSVTAYITADAYGSGALPVIDGGTVADAVLLYNQQYWHLQNLEIKGGSLHGILIKGRRSALNHFRLTNLVVHDAHGNLDTSKSTGLVVLGKWGTPTNDVVIDNVTAYSTTLWNGIAVLGLGSTPGQNIVIRNSTVHNVMGDGIIVANSQNITVENNVAYDTGNVPTIQYGTPNGIWNWSTQDAVFQYNESYLADSAGVDGGGFDVDWPSTNTVYQYNYGHDNIAYCISVFGAGNATTFDSTLRYNVCANNQRAAQGSIGDIEFATWDGGTLDGVRVYNNTMYWNPVRAYPAFVGTAAWTGTRPVFFKNNLIYSTVTNMLHLDTSGRVQSDYNLYWVTTGEQPLFQFGEAMYTGLAAWQAATGQDMHSQWAEPKLNDPGYHAVGRPVNAFTLQSQSPAINAGVDVCLGITGCDMGTHDFFGNAIPQGGAYDIGAYEGNGVAGPTATPTITPGGPTPTPTPAPVNLLQNPGFEADLTAWTEAEGNANIIVSSPVHSGNKALSVTNGGRFQPLTNLTSNAQYYLGVWGMVNTGAAYVGLKGTDGNNVAFEYQTSISSLNYAYQEVFITMPATIGSAKVYCWAPSGVTLYCDDLILYVEGGAPAPTNTPAAPTNTPAVTNTPSNTPLPPTAGPSPTATSTVPPSTTNLALNKPVTVSSTNNASTNGGNKAVDGSMTTFWRSLKRSSLPSEWIIVDLGASTTISRVECEWYTLQPYGKATNYTIQVSQDNTNWTTVATVTNNTVTTNVVTFSPVAARYVKMDSTAWYSSVERVYMYEFEIYQ